MQLGATDETMTSARNIHVCSCPFVVESALPKSGLRRVPAAPPQLLSLPARRWGATTRQTRRPPRVPLRNLRRPDEIAPPPARNRPVPGRNVRVPGRNQHLPARNGVVPSRNASVPGRNLPPRPRNHRVPTRLEHIPRGLLRLNLLGFSRLTPNKVGRTSP